MIRKKKILQEELKSEGMLKLCLNNDAIIFKEIRKQRSCKQEFPTTFDGESGNISEYLAQKYEQLYNQIVDKASILNLEFCT